MRKATALLLRLSVIFICLSGISSHAHFVASAPANPPARAFLLAVNQGDKNISVIDPAAARQITTIAEDQTNVWGHEIAASPDGRLAYVPIYGSTGVGKPGIDGREMLVIDIAARKIAATVDFGRGLRPHCAIYDRASNLVYITTELEDSITIVDPRTLKIVGEIPTTQAQSHMLVIAHDGRRGYTANVEPGTVSVLDMAGRKTVAVIPISVNTQRIAISNDDKMVFTSDQTKPQLAVIDTSKNKIKAWVALPSTGYGAAATRDGRWLLVAMHNAVAVVDLAELKVARTIPVPGEAQEIITAPDGKAAYVSCDSRVKDTQAGAGDGVVEKRIGQVAVIDLAQWKVEFLIDAGAGADGLAWVPAP